MGISFLMKLQAWPMEDMTNNSGNFRPFVKMGIEFGDEIVRNCLETWRDWQPIYRKQSRISYFLA